MKTDNPRLHAKLSVAGTIDPETMDEDSTLEASHKAGDCSELAGVFYFEKTC